MSAFERGDHVIVSQFVRRGDDADVSELDGWVVFYGEAVVVIASTPDWDDLPADDYFTASYSLDDVIVSHADATASEVGAITPAGSVALFLVAVIGIVLWAYQPIIFWTLAAVLAYAAGVSFIIALIHGANRSEEES